MVKATLVGFDLARIVFRVRGPAADGSVPFRKKLSRPQFARFPAERGAAAVLRGDGGLGQGASLDAGMAGHGHESA